MELLILTGFVVVIGLAGTVAGFFPLWVKLTGTIAGAAITALRYFVYIVEGHNPIALADDLTLIFIILAPLVTFLSFMWLTTLVRHIRNS